jgi:hypothetical protein
MQATSLHLAGAHVRINAVGEKSLAASTRDLECAAHERTPRAGFNADPAKPADIAVIANVRGPSHPS